MLKVYRHILIEKRMEREMNAFAKTDVGIERAVNQDYVYVTDRPIGPFPNLLTVCQIFLWLPMAWAVIKQVIWHQDIQ